MANLFGIDLSHHQTITSYTALRNAADFFYIKVSEADNYVDPKWSEHWGQLKGKARAPYHFLGKPTNLAGQVHAFRQQYERVSWEWGPVLDAEYNPGAPVPGSVIRAWIEEWRRQTGKQLLYVYVGYSDALHSAPLSSFVLDANVRVIVARYYSAARNAAWTSKRLGGLLQHPNVDITQYYDKARVPGIAGVADVNDARRLQTTPGTGGTEVSKQDVIDGLHEFLFDDKSWRSRVEGSSVKTSLAEALMDANAFAWQAVNGKYSEAADSVLYGKTGVRNAGALALSVYNLQHQVQALSTAIEALAADNNITADALQDMLNTAVAENVQITGTVEVNGRQTPAAPEGAQASEPDDPAALTEPSEGEQSA